MALFPNVPALLLSAVVPVLALLYGCGGSGGGSPASIFDFRTSEEETLTIEVLVDGLPAAGVFVSLSESIEEVDDPNQLTTNSSYFQGITDGTGTCRATIKLPTRISSLDVIAHARGTRGPYSHPGLRELWGPFAPSARMTVLRDELSFLTLNLERR